MTNDLHADLVKKQGLYAKTAALNDRFPDLHECSVPWHNDIPDCERIYEPQFKSRYILLSESDGFVVTTGSHDDMLLLFFVEIDGLKIFSTRSSVLARRHAIRFFKPFDPMYDISDEYDYDFYREVPEWEIVVNEHGQSRFVSEIQNILDKLKERERLIRRNHVGMEERNL